ncbi:MAG: class I adenylate-forming enzyme family protein [Candidatus Sulfotelmatobacter sp.]
MNVVDYLMDNQARADAIALLTLNGEHSYGELRQGVEAVADFLIRSGAQKGDRVLLLSDNSLFWVVGYLGTLRAGCVSVPLAPGVSSEDLKFIIGSCAIRWGFIHGKVNREQLLVIPPECKIALERPVQLPDACKLDCVSFNDVLAPPSERNSYPDIDEEKDLAAIMFTSGSTSKPRGVMVSHRNVICNTSSIIEYLKLTSQDRIMVVLPFFYCFGTSLLHTHLRVGGSLVTDPRFMFPDKVLVRMQETGCTGFAGVPSHYQILLRSSSFKKMEFPTLRYVQQAGGKLADALIRELRDALPAAKVFVMYGQTEATARLSYLPPDLLGTKLGSVGKGIPGTRLRVVDENGAPVLPGQVGEIVAEGNNIALGYWDAEGEDAVSFRNGLLYTGDLATVDEDGFIFIVDRSKDILKCGGTRSSCKAVEDALMEFDDLVEAAVIGVPDDLQGEAVKAFVVSRTKDGSLIERLRSFCIHRLPPHLIPKQIVVLDELPKGSGGKISKPALRMVN